MGKTRLCDVSEIIMGQSPTSSSYNSKNFGLPFYQGNADFGDVSPSTKYWCSKPTKIAEKNDVLLSVRAPIGAVNIATEKCCIGRGLAGIRQIDEISYYKYLYYLLKSKSKELNSLGTGSTFKAINKNNLENIKINLISVPEQEKIAGELDVVCGAMEKQKKQLELCDTLIKSKFNEMFGDFKDDIIPFQEVICDETKNGYKFNSSFYNKKGGIAIIDQGQNFICGYKEKEQDKEPFNKPCIIFGDHTEIFKLVNFPFYLGADGTKILTINNQWNIKFIYYFMLFNYVKMGGYSRHYKFLKELKFIKPPLPLQQKFADFVNEVEQNKAKIKQSLSETGTLYKALMQKYFDKGEV